MAAFTKFNQFVADVAGGVHNMVTGTSDTFYILLTNTAPQAGDTGFNSTNHTLVGSGAAEVADAGNNAPVGGKSCGTVTGSQTNGTFKLVLGTDPVWTATGSVGPFRYCVLYNSAKGSANSRPLVGFWDYGGSGVTLATGETFTVDLDGTNGVLTIA